MKIVTLLRHAKSGWDDPSLADFDRGLNPRGRRAARAIGREMKRLDLRFDYIVASPAIRVKETLAGVSETFGRLDPIYDERLYLAPASILLDLVHEADDEAGHLLLVGHNPGLEALILRLTPVGEEKLRGEVAEKFPTAALASIRFAAARWREVEPAGGRLLRFVRPRDLDPALGPDPD